MVSVIAISIKAIREQEMAIGSGNRKIDALGKEVDALKQKLLFMEHC